MQVSLPRHIPLKNVVGGIVKVAAAGSSCALINGDLQCCSLSLHLSVVSVLYVRLMITLIHGRVISQFGCKDYMARQVQQHMACATHTM